jgi:hypothetical protein
MIAGVHRVTKFLLFDIQADVGLPCEEQQYLSGVSKPIAGLVQPNGVFLSHKPANHVLYSPAYPPTLVHGGF